MIRTAGGRDLESFDLPLVGQEACPVCATPGIPVTRLVLRAALPRELHKDLARDGFFFCPTPSCPLTYFEQTVRLRAQGRTADCGGQEVRRTGCHRVLLPSRLRRASCGGDRGEGVLPYARRGGGRDRGVARKGVPYRESLGTMLRRRGQGGRPEGPGPCGLFGRLPRGAERPHGERGPLPLPVRAPSVLEGGVGGGGKGRCEEFSPYTPRFRRTWAIWS